MAWAEWDTHLKQTKTLITQTRIRVGPLWGSSRSSHLSFHTILPLFISTFAICACSERSGVERVLSVSVPCLRVISWLKRESSRQREKERERERERERGTDFALNHTWHQTKSPNSQKSLEHLPYLHFVSKTIILALLYSLALVRICLLTWFNPKLSRLPQTFPGSWQETKREWREGGGKKEEEKKGSKIPFRLYWFLARNGRRERGSESEADYDATAVKGCLQRRRLVRPFTALLSPPPPSAL